MSIHLTSGAKKTTSIFTDIVNYLPIINIGTRVLLQKQYMPGLFLRERITWTLYDKFIVRYSTTCEVELSTTYDTVNI